MQSAASDGGLPVRHGGGDVSVIESGVPRKQDDASVAKHTMEKQLRRATTRRKEIISVRGLIKQKLDGITVT